MEYKIEEYERFNSIDEMMKTLNARPVNKLFLDKRSSRETSNKRFFGTKNYTEAIHLLSNGWEEPVEKIKAGMRKEVKSNVSTVKRRPVLGVSGFAPHIPNAILGLPNSMISTERTEQKVKALTIIYSPCVNANWAASEILECGITMLNIINDIEKSGYRINLYIEAITVVENNKFFGSCVNVKNYREHLDLRKLAFPLANASMLRRIGFDWLEKSHVKEKSIVRGYGRPIGNTDYEEVKKFYLSSHLLNKNEYYISAQLINKCNHDKEKVLEAAGISI